MGIKDQLLPIDCPFRLYRYSAYRDGPSFARACSLIARIVVSKSKRLPNRREFITHECYLGLIAVLLPHADSEPRQYFHISISVMSGIAAPKDDSRFDWQIVFYIKRSVTKVFVKCLNFIFCLVAPLPPFAFLRCLAVLNNQLRACIARLISVLLFIVF